MKKILSVIMVCFICVLFVACKNDDAETTNTSISYAIVYNLNGGINSEENPETIGADDGEVELKYPTRYAYVFDGWFTSSDFQGQAITKLDSSLLNEVVTLYAKWTFDESYVDKLPFVKIETQDGELPADKVNYINCSFSLSNCEMDEYDFAVEMKSEYGEEDSVGIRLRGNSTMYAPKQPYRIKFDKKKSLFGLEKNKSWVLLADYFDQSSIRNYTAFTLGNYFDNLDFTPTPNHVVLMINGEWKGLYLLCEQVDENEGRTNIENDFDATFDTNFPFLIEMDQLALNEGITGVDNFQVDGLEPIEIKYPEYDERGGSDAESNNVFNYIKRYITAVYNTLSTTETVYFKGKAVAFEDLVDVDSFIDYHLLNEFMYNPDNPKKSIYMHKTKIGKLEFGPIWDFDIACNNDFIVPFRYSYIDCAQKLVISRRSKLFNLYIQNESNYNKVKERWMELSNKISNILEELRVYKNEIRSIAHKDALLWYGETGMFQFDMQYDYVRLFLYDRINFLNYAFSLNYADFINLL